MHAGTQKCQRKTTKVKHIILTSAVATQYKPADSSSQTGQPLLLPSFHNDPSCKLSCKPNEVLPSQLKLREPITPI